MRLLTLNLNYDGSGHGPWPRRRALVAAAIAESGADVVCLQAVLRDPHRHDQLRELVDALPSHRHAFFVAAERSGCAARGSAILSRLPLRAPRHLRLSRRRGHEDGSERVLVSVDAAGARVLNAHFSWVEAQGRDNIREALRWSGGAQGLAVLAGDFNMEPGARALSRLRRAGWTDAWDAVRPGEDGATFDAALPRKRIDYVWASPDAAARLRAATVIARERGGERLSDHLGLLAIFR